LCRQYYKALPTLSVEYQFMQIFNRRLRRHVYDLLGRPFSVPLATVRRLEREEKAARRLIRGKEKLIDDDDEEDDDEDDDDEDEGEDGVGEKKGKALQRRGKGKIGGKKNGNRKGKCSRVAGGAGGKEGEDDDEALDLADMGRELARQVGFHALTRGIAVGVTLLTSVVHMPLCTITNSILASPSSYTGPIDCAQKILTAEGWQGFYKVPLAALSLSLSFEQRTTNTHRHALQGLFWYVLYTSDVLFLHDVWTGAELSLAD
jgi:hypothetical protein